MKPAVWRTDAPPDAQVALEAVKARIRLAWWMRAGAAVSPLAVIVFWSSFPSPWVALVVVAVASLGLWLVAGLIHRRARAEMLRLRSYLLPAQDRMAKLDSKICRAANQWLTTADADIVGEHQAEVEAAVRRAQSLRTEYASTANEADREQILESMRRVLAQMQLLGQSARKGAEGRATRESQSKEERWLHSRREDVAQLEAVVDIYRNAYQHYIAANEELRCLPAMPTTTELESEIPPVVQGPTLLTPEVQAIVRRVLDDKSPPGTAAFRRKAYCTALRVQGYGAALALAEEHLRSDQTGSLVIVQDDRVLRDVRAHMQFARDLD